jgi:hypothetical protein
MNGGTDEGPSDNGGIRDPHLLLRQLQTFLTATINGIISTTRGEVKSTSSSNIVMVYITLVASVNENFGLRWRGWTSMEVQMP